MSDVIGSSARLLNVLTLLSSRPTWTCAELGRRLDVTDRTVRRDIARLRDIGYTVDSEPGPWGGYRLARGNTIPALTLDVDEAFAVAVALRESAHSGVLGEATSAISALFKLRRVLPERVGRYIDDMDAVLAHTPSASPPQADPGVLAALASACRVGQRLALTYRDHHGHRTDRHVDPYRLVRANRRWYLLAHDVAKHQWRTFRVDRVAHTRPTGADVDYIDPPDAATFVAEAIAAVPYPLHATIEVPLPLWRALEAIPASIGKHRADGPETTIVDIGVDDAETLVSYLLGLGIPLRVLGPDSVRSALVERLDTLRRDNP